MLKKILAGALSVSMLLGMAAVLPEGASLFDNVVTASAEGETSGTCGENVTWKIDADGTLTISGSGDTYNYYTYAVNEMPFYENTSIKKVVVQEGVTGLGSFLFYRCNFTSISLPDSLTSIGENVFNKCTGIKSITIPSGVTSIKDTSFLGCHSLESIEVDSGNQLFSSADGVLYNKEKTKLLCSPAGIANVTIPDTVTCIGSNALHGCEKLKTLTIPDSVTDIEMFAFTSCYGLESVKISNRITKLDRSVFSDCTSLADVTIPDSVTEIGVYAFWNCVALTNVVIPSNVKTIGEMAFCYCTGLKSVTIPGSVTEILSSAFYSCENLSSVTIPGSVVSIGGSAFESCTSLSDVTFGKGIKSIGKYAFSGCRSLTSVTIPDGLETISDYAFSECENLASATIPKSVTSIEDCAFMNCHYSLTFRCYSDSCAYDYASVHFLPYVLLDATPAKTNISKCTITNNLAEVFYTGTPRIIDNYLVVKDGSKTLVKGTDYTTSYSNNTAMGLNTAKVTITGKGGYTGSKTISFTIKPKTQAQPTVSTTGLNLRVQWTKDTTVTGYQIAYDTTAACKSANVKYAYATSYTNYAKTITGLPAGKTYYARVRAYKTVDGKNVYGKWSAASAKIVIKPGALAISSVSSTVAKKAVVRWGTVPKGSTGVQIQYALNSSFTNANLASVGNTTTLYKTLTGLTSGKTYYVRIRTYVKVGTVTTYGAWSTAKKVKAK